MVRRSRVKFQHLFFNECITISVERKQKLRNRLRKVGAERWKWKSMNRNNRKFLYLTVLTLCLIWIYFSRIPADATSAAGTIAPHSGFLAPEISLVDTNGREFTLSELRGRPVILNFWATWCPPCKAEMPAMQRAYRDYGEEVIFLAVNSTNQDSLPAVRQFVDALDITFPVLLDDLGTAANTYRISSLPSTYFIGKDGVINEVVIGGPMAEALLRSRIDRLLEGVP
jgi:cytochrome c biogenesis protein CcmG, thiol:disulfide interchange protein DsbE